MERQLGDSADRSHDPTHERDAEGAEHRTKESGDDAEDDANEHAEPPTDTTSFGLIARDRTHEPTVILVTRVGPSSGLSCTLNCDEPPCRRRWHHDTVNTSAESRASFILLSLATRGRPARGTDDLSL